MGLLWLYMPVGVSPVLYRNVLCGTGGTQTLQGNEFYPTFSHKQEKTEQIIQPFMAGK